MKSSTNTLLYSRSVARLLPPLQLSLVYVNTLMVQEVLSTTKWSGRLTDEDTRGLTPLLYGHVNPYGRFFELDITKRLRLGEIL